MIRLNSTHGPSTLGSSTRSTPIERYAGGEFTRTSDFVSVEEPLLLVLNGRPFATLMRTPGQDVALIEGFLFTEGIVGAPEDIVRIEATAHPSSQEMAVELAAGCAVPEMDARASYLSSSCGVCGRASIAQLMSRIEAVKPMDIGLAFLVGLIPAFDAAQRDFRLTGGVHAAALFGQGGRGRGAAQGAGQVGGGGVSSGEIATGRKGAGDVVAGKFRYCAEGSGGRNPGDCLDGSGLVAGCRSGTGLRHRAAFVLASGFGGWLWARMR